MSIIYWSSLLTGITIFLTGYYFIGKSSGQVECEKTKNLFEMQNYQGGLAGVIIGIIFIVVAFVFRFGDAAKERERMLFR
jgi:Ni,Fe-hydrogenase I cytochrome b subunit